MTLLLDKNGFIPALKNMACPAAASVEGLGIPAVQLSYAGGEIRIWGLNEYVIVVGHKTVRVTDPVIILHHLSKDRKKTPPVHIIQENILPGIAS